MSPFLYLAVIFLEISRITSTLLFPFSTDFQNKEDSSLVNASSKLHPVLNPPLQPQCEPQYIVTPQYNPTSGSIFANEPSVTIFTNKFFQTLQTSEILREVLDLSQTTAKQYADFLRQNNELILLAVGVEKDNAAAISEFAARAITPNFKILTLPVVARAYCNCAANFLFVNGVLELQNAENLSSSFAKSLVNSAKLTMNSDPTSKFTSLTIGSGIFYQSLGLISKTKAQLLSYYIGNEWTVAAVNYKLL